MIIALVGGPKDGEVDEIPDEWDHITFPHLSDPPTPTTPWNHEEWAKSVPIEYVLYLSTQVTMNGRRVFKYESCR